MIKERFQTDAANATALLNPVNPKKAPKCISAAHSYGPFALIEGGHDHQPGMNFVDVLPTQNPTLESFKIYFRRVLPEIQRLWSRILDGENVDEDLFRLAATLASNTRKSSTCANRRDTPSHTVIASIKQTHYQNPSHHGDLSIIPQQTRLHQRHLDTFTKIP